MPYLCTSPTMTIAHTCSGWACWHFSTSYSHFHRTALESPFHSTYLSFMPKHLVSLSNRQTFFIQAQCTYVTNLILKKCLVLTSAPVKLSLNEHFLPSMWFSANTSELHPSLTKQIVHIFYFIFLILTCPLWANSSFNRHTLSYRPSAPI